MAVSYGPKIGTANVPDGFVDGDTYTPPMDRFLRMIQALAQLNVISYSVTAPPGSPSDGDTYLVPAGATGAWTGHDQSVAYWTLHDLANPSGVWEFYVPRTGWFAYDNADGNFYRFDGAVWVALNFATTAFQSAPSWFGSFEGGPFPWQGWPGGSNGQWGVAGGAGGNVVKVCEIRIPGLIKVSKLTYFQLGVLAGSVSAYGIYSADGLSKLLAWENINTGTGGGTKTTTISQVSLPPGIYKAVCSCSGNGASPATLGGYGTSGTNEPSQPWNTNGTVRVGVAANPMVGGVLPATLGAISLSANVGVSLPSITLEP